MNLFVVANFVMACCWKVPRLPALGETVCADGLSIEPGGKGLNVAVGAKRLGVHVNAMFGIGDDHAGDELLALLAREGIATAHVHRLGRQSGYGAGLINADGGNAIAVYPGPNLLLAASHADLAAAVISQADWVYGQFETSIGALSRCFQLARQQGLSTMLNPSPWQAIPPALLVLTEVILVNEIEAAALLSLPAALGGGLASCAAILEDAAQRFWPVWPGRLLVVTLGEFGCVALRRDQAVLAVPGFAIQALDTVGAGDAFAAGLLKKIGDHADLPDALLYANACGAMVAAMVGVLDALPSDEAVAQFLRAGS